MIPATSSKKTREEIAQAYQSEPWWYDIRGLFILTFSYNATIPEQLRFFGRNMGKQHLELACGTGTLLALILLWRRWHRMPMPHIVGVDYSESMLAGAIHRFRKQAEIELFHGDAAELPFEEDRFDTINIANSVHCFPKPVEALCDALRVLKPGGTLRLNVLMEPNGYGLLAGIARRINDWGKRKGILYKPYLRDELPALLRAAGYHIDSESVSGNCLSVVSSRPKAP